MNTLTLERRIRLSGAAALALFALSLASVPAFGQRVDSLNGDSYQLSSRILSPNTLLLIVETEGDLSEALRVLTLAESVDQAVLVLIALPSESPGRARAIRAAAKRFFRSSFSRRHVYFADSAALPYTPSKAVLVAPDSSAPLWRSNAFPSELPPP